MSACGTENTKSLRNEINRENAIQETKQKLAFPQFDVKEVKLKIKIIRTGNAAELPKVIKWGWELVQTHTTFTCRNRFGSDKHIHSRVAFVFYEPRCQKGPFF